MEEKDQRPAQRKAGKLLRVQAQRSAKRTWVPEPLVHTHLPPVSGAPCLFLLPSSPQLGATGYLAQQQSRLCQVGGFFLPTTRVSAAPKAGLPLGRPQEAVGFACEILTLTECVCSFTVEELVLTPASLGFDFLRVKEEFPELLSNHCFYTGSRDLFFFPEGRWGAA